MQKNQHRYSFRSIFFSSFFYFWKKIKTFHTVLQFLNLILILKRWGKCVDAFDNVLHPLPFLFLLFPCKWWLYLFCQISSFVAVYNTKVPKCQSTKVPKYQSTKNEKRKTKNKIKQSWMCITCLHQINLWWTSKKPLNGLKHLRMKDE